jgi:inner membrane protein
MQGRNHVALALAGALIIVNPGQDVIGWVVLTLGSLFPDVDGHGMITHPGALMPRIVPGPMRKLSDILGHVISDLVQHVFGHRGAFHYPIWYVLLAAIGYRAGVTWLVWFALGALAHLAGDLLTKSGIPLFGPVSRRDVALTPMRTGSAVESLFGLVLWGVVAWRAYPLLAGLPYIGYLIAMVQQAISTILEMI